MRHTNLLAVPTVAVIAAVCLAATGARADAVLGEPAPDFTLKDQDGKDVTLSSYAGKRAVVLAFYPKAFTKGCENEIRCFAREARKIEERGAALLAISVDPVARQKEFATSLGVNFPLLSDESRKVSKAYGVFMASPDGGMSARSTFIVDKAGKIRWMEKDFLVPKTLEGSVLLAELEKIMDPADDPASAFAKLPSPEKEARTVLVRWGQVHTREDVGGMIALMHPNYGWRGDEPEAQWKARREAELARMRKLFDASDVRALEFKDLFDPARARVLAKADIDRGGISGTLGESFRRAAAAVQEGDLLVVATTKAPKCGDAEVLPKDVALHLRRDGEAWKILHVVR